MDGSANWQPVHLSYLSAVYELGERSDGNGVEPIEVETKLGLDQSQAGKIVEFLVDAGVMVWPAKGMLMLTQPGLKQAKRLFRGSKATDFRFRVSLSPRPMPISPS